MSGTEHTVDGQTRAETFPDPMITSNTAEDGTETLKKDSISPPADPVISKLKDEAAGVPDTASLSTDDMPTVMTKSPRATPLRIDSPGTRTPLIETPPMTDDLEENPLAERAPEKDKPEDDDTPVPPEDILTPPPGATFAPFPTSDKASDKASEHDDIPETSKEEAAESTPAAAPVDEALKELSAPPPEAEETTEKPGEASLASEAPEEKSEEQQPLEQQHNTHVETIGSTQEPREELQIGDDNLSRAVEAGHPLAGVESDLLDDTTTLNDTATVDTEQNLAPSLEKAEEIPSEHASITPMVSKDPEESEKLAEQAKEADEHAPVAPSDFLRPEKTEEQEPEQEQPSEHASLVPQVSKDPEESEKLEEQAKEAEEAAPAASVGDEKPHEPESTPDNELADAPPPPHIPVEDLNETDDAIAVAAKEEEEAEDKSEAPLIADTGVVAEEVPPTEVAPSTAEQHVTEEQEKPIKLVEEQAPEEPAIAEEHPMETETKIQELAAATTVGAPAAAVLEHQRRSEEEDERPAEQELEKEDDAQNLTAGPIEGISKDEEGGITLGSGVSDPIAPTEASPFEKEEEKDDNKLGQGAALAGGAALAAAGVAAATQDDDDEKPTEEASPAPEEEQEKPSHNLLAGQMTPPAEVGTPRTQELVEAEEGHSTVPIPQETDVPLTDSNTLEAALNPTAEGAAIAVGEHVAEPADAPAAPAADEQPTEGEPQTPSALIPQQGGTGLASDILSRKGSERRESSAEYPPLSFKQEAAQTQEPEAAVEETPEQAKEEEDDDNKTAKMAAAGVGATALGGAAAAAMFHDSEAQEPVQSKFYEHENDPVDIPPQDEKQIPHDGPVEAPLIAPTDAPLDGPLGTDESVVTDVSTIGAPTISGELESLDHFNEQRNQQEAEESPMELKQPPAEKPMEVSNEEFGRNTNEPTTTETPAGAAPVEAVGVPVVSGDNEEDAAAFDRFGADTPMPEDNPSNSLDLAGAKEKVPEEISESQDEEISREETGTPVIEKLEDPAEVEKNKHEEEEPVEEIIASSPTLERADEKDGHGHEEPEEHALDHKVEEEKKEEKEEDKGLGDKIKEAAVATAGAVGLGALAHQLTKDDDEKEEQKEAEKTEEVTEAPKEDEPAVVQPTEQEAAGETAIVHDENAVPTEDLAEESAEKPVEHPVESSTTEQEAAPIHPTEKEAATEAQLAFAENAVPVASLAGRTVDEQPSTDSATDLVSATEVAHAADDAGVAPEEGAEVHKEGDQVVVVPDHHGAVEAEPVSKAPAEEQPSTDSTAALVEATEVAHAADDAGVSPEEGAEVQKDESETPVVIPEHHEAVEAEPIAKPIEEEQIVDESSVLATSEEQPEELKKLEDDPELQREVEADPELAEQVHMPTADQIKHEEEEAHLREVVEMPTSDQIKHEEEEAALQEKVEMPTADQVTKEDEPTEAAAPEEHEAPKDVHFYQVPTDDKHVEEEPVVSKDVHYGETAKAPHEDTTEAKDEEHDHDKVAAAGLGAAALGAGALAVHELGDHKEEAPQVPVETTAPEEPGVEEPIVAPDAPEEKIEETQKDDLVAAAPEEEIKKDLVEDEPIAAVAPEETKTEESVVEEKPTEVTEEPPKDASVAEPAAAAVAAEPETKDEEPEAKPEEPEASKEEALVEKAKDVSKDVAEDHSGAIAGTAAALGVAGGAAAAAMASKDDDKKDEKHDEEDDEEEEDEDHKDEDGKPKKRKSLLKRVKDKAKHALHRDHHEEEAKPKEHKEEEHKEDVAAAAPVEREAPVEEKTEEEPIAPTKEASTHHAGAGLAAAGTIGTLHEATKKAEEPEQPDTTTEMPMEPAPTLEGPTHEDHANASPDITVLRSHPGQNIGESFVIPPADSGEGLVFDDELAKEIDATNRGDLSKEGAKEPEKPVEPIETPAAKALEAPEETVPAPVDKTAEARPTTAEGPSDASEGHYALHKDDTPAEQTPAPESTPSSAAPATGSEDITPRVMGHETSTELLRKLYVSPEALDEAATNPSQTSSMKERGLLADDVKTQPAEESAEATTTSAAPVAAPEGSELRQRKEPPAATVEDEAGPSSKPDDRPSSQAGTMTSTRQKNMMQAFWGVFFLGFFGGIGRFFTGMFGKKKA